jgi:phosphoadenosine phosphosulfate reductase
MPMPPFAIAEESPPEELVAWVLERFSGRRVLLTTSFGMEGCALIDMFAAHGGPAPAGPGVPPPGDCAQAQNHDRAGLRVVYLDTMFLFPETYRLRDRMVERYPHIEFLNRGTALTPEEQARRYGPELWRTDPDRCCRLRKVDPMRRVLAEADVWVTSLMRSQSSTRAGIQVVEWDWQYQVLRVHPLASWDRARVWQYVREHDVPYNELHDRGYPSVGCTHCTLPVLGARAVDYTRAGRWPGSSKTECGLHWGGP